MVCVFSLCVSLLVCCWLLLFCVVTTAGDVSEALDIVEEFAGSDVCCCCRDFVVAGSDVRCCCRRYCS